MSHTLLRNFPVQLNYFNVKFSLPTQFTLIHMFHAIQAKFPTALLQVMSIDTSQPKSLSQITPTLPSFSLVSPIQRPVTCPCKYLIAKNIGYPSSQLIKNIIFSMKIYICAFKAVTIETTVYVIAHVPNFITCPI